MKRYKVNAFDIIGHGEQPLQDVIITDLLTDTLYQIPELVMLYGMDPKERQQKFGVSITQRSVLRYETFTEAASRAMLYYTPVTLSEVIERFFGGAENGLGSHMRQRAHLVARVVSEITELQKVCVAHPTSCFFSHADRSYPKVRQSLLYSVLLGQHYTKEQIVDMRSSASDEALLVDHLATLISDTLYGLAPASLPNSAFALQLSSPYVQVSSHAP